VASSKTRTSSSLKSVEPPRINFEDCVANVLQGEIKKGLNFCNPLIFSALQGGLLSNQFWDELRVYATLNYLFIQLMNNREVGLILIGLSIL
jgi:hypothetical protein